MPTNESGKPHTVTVEGALNKPVWLTINWPDGRVTKLWVHNEGDEDMISIIHGNGSSRAMIVGNDGDHMDIT